MYIKDYCSLIRIKNQTGTLLLFIPCFLGLLASSGINVQDTLLFLVSAFFARSCGCILNDIADSKIDSTILTTSSRPLANKTLTIRQARKLFLSLIICSIPLLTFFSKHILFPLAITGVLVILYPYSKRFFPVPQLFLGLTYASGFIIAISHSLNQPLSALHPKIYIFYFGLVIWVIIFDTIYAKRDLKYDAQAKIKSSTIFVINHYQKSIALILILIVAFTIILYTHFLLTIFLPPLLIRIYCFFKKQNYERSLYKINTVLLYAILLSNIMFSIFAWLPTQYYLLAINTLLQSISVFLKPADGFKLNAICALPLAGVFLV